MTQTKQQKSHNEKSARPPRRKISGWVVIDKPLEKTSTQIVGAVRRAYNVKKVGHAGTLDPLATGVVTIAIGEATKTVPYVQDYEKVYEFRISWGEQRNTDDAEGEIIEQSDKRPTIEDVTEALKDFKGAIEQTPPQFSAIKIDGKRAYAMARAGETVDIKSRIVDIYDVEILGHDTDWVDLRIECGKGTYVRSIGRDMGIKLGCFGYISQLRRTAVGVFDVENAISLDFLEENAKTPLLDDYLLPVETALDDIPALALKPAEANTLSHGGFIRLFSQQDVSRLEKAGIVDNQDDPVIAYAFADKPLGLVSVKGAEIRPHRLFNL